jgi:hypothetical protein
MFKKIALTLITAGIAATSFAQSGAPAPTPAAPANAASPTAPASDVKKDIPRPAKHHAMKKHHVKHGTKKAAAKSQ